ncbi:MAG: hypothetical protein LBC93_09245 [Synergistaceae bacterium]|jgi:4-hydroxybutyrate CoA-transferase|nr:hypothetical protein [Synergistaceae bacterium]
MAVIAVKYCGGCNPRYDRVGFVRSLQGDFPELEVAGADAAEPDFALVVCGCPARCVQHEQLTGRQGKFVAASPEDREALCAALAEMR